MDKQKLPRLSYYFGMKTIILFTYDLTIECEDTSVD